MLFKYLLFKITKKEHSFTVKWCLNDKKTKERVIKDFIISTVGVWNKEDIRNKRLINKTVANKLEINKKIKELIDKGEINKDCELSYNIICYYGRMKRR